MEDNELPTIIFVILKKLFYTNTLNRENIAGPIHNVISLSNSSPPVAFDFHP